MQTSRSDIRPLVVREFTARFGERKILSIDRLEIQRGERFGLSGRSGSGKTTLLRAIVDDWVGVADVPEIELNVASLCYVPQHAGLLPWYSLRDNIAAMMSLGEHLSLPDQRIHKLLDVFDLADVLDTAASQLSGGEFRRAALLVGMLRVREFCIFDEPLNGVDFDRKMVILDWVAAEIAAVDASLLVVSHDPDVLATLCTYVAFLEGAPAMIDDVVAIVSDGDKMRRQTVRDRLTGR